jgi:hypothetical protein
VRQALKPRATIIMAENKFIIPFDADGNGSVLRSAHDDPRLCVGSRMARHGASKANMTRAGAGCRTIPSCGKHNGRDARPGRCLSSFGAPPRPGATTARDPPSRRAAARPLSVGYFHALGNGTAT